MSRSRFALSQRTTIVMAMLCFIGVIVVLQLWLFTATMEAYLGGNDVVVVPAAIASLACLGLSFGLRGYLRRL